MNMRAKKATSSTGGLFWAFAKGGIGATLLSGLLIFSLSGRESIQKEPAIPVTEETPRTKHATPKPGPGAEPGFWLGDQLIQTHHDLETAREARRQKTRDYYTSAYKESEDFRRQQISQVRTQFMRDRMDVSLEEAALTEEEIQKMERARVMIW